MSLPGFRLRYTLALLTSLAFAGCDDGSSDDEGLPSAPGGKGDVVDGDEAKSEAPDPSQFKQLRFNMRPFAVLQPDAVWRYRLDLAGESSVRLGARLERLEWMPTLVVTTADGTVLEPASVETSAEEGDGNRLNHFYEGVSGSLFVTMDPQTDDTATRSHLSLECTGGACDITEHQRAVCIEAGYRCALDEALGQRARQAQAAAPDARTSTELLATCLADLTVDEGVSCVDACNHSFFGDSDVLGANRTCKKLPAKIDFFADNTPECRAEADTCLAACEEEGVSRGDDLEFLVDEDYDAQTFPKCWDGGGGVSDGDVFCPEFAERTDTCGGDLEAGTGEHCFFGCVARIGWNAEIDTAIFECEEECDFVFEDE